MTALALETARPDPAAQATAIVKLALAGSIDRNGVLPPTSESQVHKAIDLLRATRGDPGLLNRLEAMSCELLKMRLYLRQGRVNAYASARLRLRSAAKAI